MVSKRAGGTQAAPGETVIDLDRTHPVLGNTFFLRDPNDDAERERVIAQYGQKLDADLKRAGPMSLEIDSLAQRVLRGERLALRCWCAPKHCHVDLVRDRIFLALDMDPGEAPRRAKPKQMGLF